MKNRHRTVGIPTISASDDLVAARSGASSGRFRGGQTTTAPPGWGTGRGGRGWTVVDALT